MKSLAYFFVLTFGANTWAMGAKAPAPVAPPPRVLKKLVVLDPVSAAPLENTNHNTLDLAAAVNDQFLASVVGSKKFAVKLLQGSGYGPTVCLPEPAQIRLAGAILGFEMVSSDGISFGFNGAASLDLIANAKLVIQSARMSAAFNAVDFEKNNILGAVQVGQSETQTDINAEIDFAQLFKLGYQHFSVTPLAKVLQKAISKGIARLSAQTDSFPWEAHLIQSVSNDVEINAGADALLHVGDQFRVTKVTPYWQGAPCQSNFLGSTMGPQASAIVQVYDVEANSSWASVLSRSDELRLGAGDLVEIEKLQTP